MDAELVPIVAIDIEVFADFISRDIGSGIIIFEINIFGIRKAFIMNFDTYALIVGGATDVFVFGDVDDEVAGAVGGGRRERLHLKFFETLVVIVRFCGNRGCRAVVRGIVVGLVVALVVDTEGGLVEFGHIAGDVGRFDEYGGLGVVVDFDFGEGAEEVDVVEPFDASGGHPGGDVLEVFHPEEGDAVVGGDGGGHRGIVHDGFCRFDKVLYGRPVCGRRIGAVPVGEEDKLEVGGLEVLLEFFGDGKRYVVVAPYLSVGIVEGMEGEVGDFLIERVGGDAAGSRGGAVEGIEADVGDVDVVFVAGTGVVGSVGWCARGAGAGGGEGVAHVEIETEGPDGFAGSVGGTLRLVGGRRACTGHEASREREEPCKDMRRYGGVACEHRFLSLFRVRCAG